MTPKTLAQAIPAKVRGTLYSILAALIGLELVWDVVPDVLEGKLLGSLAVLGFGVAALNTGNTPPPAPPAGGVPEQFPGEFA